MTTLRYMMNISQFVLWSSLEHFESLCSPFSFRILDVNPIPELLQMGIVDLSLWCALWVVSWSDYWLSVSAQQRETTIYILPSTIFLNNAEIFHRINGKSWKISTFFNFWLSTFAMEFGSTVPSTTSTT